MNYFYNAHTHVFTFKNVPDKFGKTFAWGLAGVISIQKVRRSQFFRWALRVMRKLKKSDADGFDRMANFVEHGQGKDAVGKDITQKDILKNLQSYYPVGTRFIALSMDMEYMDAGAVPEKYDLQTKELEEIKRDNRETFYPFIFADPRRISDRKTPFNGETNFVEYLKKKLADQTFNGIKMYPALGYWPFDKNMEDVYDFALEKSVPIMVHCSGGPVYNRGKKKFDFHPIFNQIKLGGEKAKEFSTHFSNPINYHMLLNPEIISKYWGKEKDYRQLKICLGHFGGDVEWMKYLQNPWVAAKGAVEESEFASLDPKNLNYNKNFESGKYTWFSVICDLLRKYDNVYADISSSLEEERIFPLLKMLLESSETLRKKILFGTDYYMVSIDKSERELSIGLRSYLGEELFEQIAVTNVEKYLF